MLLAYPLIGICPFFLKVYSILWYLYKPLIFKVGHYEDFVIFPFVLFFPVFCNKVCIFHIFIPSTLMQGKMILAVIKKK